MTPRGPELDEEMRTMTDQIRAYVERGRANLDALETRQRLRTLAHNLATAGALCAAFYEGFDAGFTQSGEGFNGEYAPNLTGEGFREMQQSKECGGAYSPTWKPGCGTPAPGWSQP